MKKLLLFTSVISFLVLSSCTRDEKATQVSLAEKEYLVKQTIIEFNKSAIKTGKYSKFLNTISQKSAIEPLTRDELEVLIRDFLGEQTQEFLDVYYELELLNMNSEEFYSIASQFEYLKINAADSDKTGGCCSTSVPPGHAILSALLDWSCGCRLARSADIDY